MDNPIALHAIVRGHVQGVYFRAFVSGEASALGLTGFVRNVSSGDAVEVWAEGEQQKLETLINRLKTGPPYSRVDKVTTEWIEFSGKYTDFVIKYD